MGCSGSRVLYPSEESHFIESESLLLYSNLACTEVDLMHRKYSYSGVINENQWRNIYRQLNLAQNQISKPIPEKIRAFYELFKINENYTLQEMLVLGVLLTKGSPETKAKLIFEAFDTLDSKELSQYIINEIFNLLYKIAVKRIEILVDKSDPVRKESHDMYLKKLKLGKPAFRNAFIQSIIGKKESISIQAFVEGFKENQKSTWLNSSGFRIACKEFCKGDGGTLPQKEPEKNSKI